LLLRIPGGIEEDFYLVLHRIQGELHAGIGGLWPELEEGMAHRLSCMAGWFNAGLWAVSRARTCWCLRWSRLHCLGGRWWDGREHP
jgi:hypothetical protein